jgi:hypothetical protein
MLFTFYSKVSVARCATCPSSTSGGSARPQDTPGVDAEPTAVLDGGVEDRGSLSSLAAAYEKPVLRATFGRADRILDEVVVDLDATVARYSSSLPHCLAA